MRCTMLCPRDRERCRFLGASLSRTALPTACLLSIAWMASLVPALEPDLARAEINNTGSLAPYLLIADQAARPRSFKQTGSNAVHGASSGAMSVGTWRLVRTPNPWPGRGFHHEDGRRLPLGH